MVHNTGRGLLEKRQTLYEALGAVFHNPTSTHTMKDAEHYMYVTIRENN